LAATGDLEAALVIFREDLETNRWLVTRDPDNTQWRRDLSASLERIADILLSRGNRDQALSNYRECVTIMRGLLTKDPEQKAWQRDLSVYLDKVANVLQAQGDRNEAIAVYRESLAPAHNIAMDKSNTDAQRRLVHVLMLLASMEDEPRARLKEALHILEQLKTEDRIQPDQIEQIEKIKINLGAVSDNDRNSQ
jgi:tetratricopeptide (TPR) repeat protein